MCPESILMCPRKILMCPGNIPMCPGNILMCPRHKTTGYRVPASRYSTKPSYPVRSYPKQNVLYPHSSDCQSTAKNLLHDGPGYPYVAPNSQVVSLRVQGNIVLCLRYIPMCPNRYPSDSQAGRAGGKLLKRAR